MILPVPPHQRGVSRSSRAWRRDAVGASDCSVGSSCADERSGAHGQAVWSWHPGADAKFATTFAGDGGKNAGPRGERGVSRKAIAQGRPVVRLVPVVLPRAFCCTRTMGAACTRPSPAPSLWKRAKPRQSSDAKRAARQPDRVPNAVLKGTPSMPLPFPLLYPPL
jgi:hypothetical protein